MKPYYEHNGITIYHGDCREILPQLEPVDLVLTDPPYGIREDSYRTANKGKLAKTTDYGEFDWDVKLDYETIELIRHAGSHQIIFGGNYYADWLPASRCWVVWDKDNTGDFADCELAWTSFDKAVRMYKYRWNGMLQQPGVPKEKRLYPTQKPISLMRWCIMLTADPRSMIDPCMGGGSTIRAAKDLGLQRIIGIDKRETACEIAAQRLSQEVLWCV